MSKFSFLENSTCGICDYKAKGIENLEKHITTCQIYKGCCNQIYSKLSEVKTHNNSEHKGRKWLIKHIFMDPNNSEFIVEKVHYSDNF